MYQLLLNIQLTRRQSMCYILNTEGDLVWSGKNASAAFAYLVDNNQLTVQVPGQPEAEVLILHIEPA